MTQFMVQKCRTGIISAIPVQGQFAMPAGMVFMFGNVPAYIGWDQIIFAINKVPDRGRTFNKSVTVNGPSAEFIQVAEYFIGVRVFTGKQVNQFEGVVIFLQERNILQQLCPTAFFATDPVMNRFLVRENLEDRSGFHFHQSFDKFLCQRGAGDEIKHGIVQLLSSKDGFRKQFLCKMRVTGMEDHGMAA